MTHTSTDYTMSKSLGTFLSQYFYNTFGLKDFCVRSLYLMWMCAESLLPSLLVSSRCKISNDGLLSKFRPRRSHFISIFTFSNELSGIHLHFRPVIFPAPLAATHSIA